MPAHLTPRRCLLILGGVSLLLLLAMLLSLAIGSSSLPLGEVLHSGEAGQAVRDVIFNLRLPRTLAAVAVGGLLALAGCLQQVLLRNPLADPYVLGTSGGASVGALLALLLGAGLLLVNLAAALGALATIVIVFLLAGQDHSATQSRLLLTGVALAAFCGALSSLLLSMAPDGLLRGMVFWLLGDLSAAPWQWPLLALLGLLLMALWLAPVLNVMGMGLQSAHSLGLNVHTLRWGVYLLSAAACALAVTSAGMIGFVGLIVPHALRLLLGQDLRLLLPAAVLGGALVLLLADVLARTLLAPQQLPVGVVMGLIGVPVFLWQLSRRAAA
ncbi:FecCD family ABC transporter permease [Chitinilyticum piscinae]|uniref:Iron ABC transporter permease n=1 Tax=Chitinilyticum piscinae TaxID=2866724 RepID=A0A8J7G3Y1_9NEIS|nr:iron ABC transporter permease [Chitinilyticum piscinae]MBE9610988.1 iron ABC transporter permease [Chitinilyticum piscinae]